MSSRFLHSLKTFVTTLTRLSARYSLLALLGVGCLAGIVLLGGTYYAFEVTSSPQFCANACHEMHTATAEYQQSPHYNNRSGVRAQCADCHIPKPLLPKLEKKLLSVGELWGKVSGSIATPEKFAAKRLELAQLEWARMKATDSRECRSCHQVAGMATAKQTPRAVAMHTLIGENGRTCIDCHKGIAHQLPADMPEEE